MQNCAETAHAIKEMAHKITNAQQSGIAVHTRAIGLVTGDSLYALSGIRW